MKTVFSSGVIVTSQFLNGAQQIYFDGSDNDWHYPPLGLNSLVQTGVNGLDSAYVTLDTDQPSLITTGPTTGLYSSGTPISGTKVATGVFNFGYNPAIAGNPSNTVANAPQSYTTNSKYDAANGILTPDLSQKFAALSDADLVTKKILVDRVDDLIDKLEIDNGVYASSAGSCENYSLGGGNSDVVCPL